MKKNLKIFFLLSLFSIKSSFQHKTGIIFFMFGKILRFLMFFLFVYYLLLNTKLLAGYSLPETVVFFLTFNLIDTLAQLLFREVYRFRSLVVSGDLDTVLVKPYNSLLRVLLGGIDILDLFLVLPYALLVMYFIIQIPTFSVFSLFLYLILLINALFIAAGLHIIVLALGILTTEVDHTVMIYRDLTKMAAMPVDIYIEPIRSIITFVVPIGIMMTFPVKALFGLLSAQFILISLGYSIVSMIVGLLFWKKALAKYQSWGS